MAGWGGTGAGPGPGGIEGLPAPPPPLPPEAEPPKPFRPLDRRARWAIGLLALVILGNAVSIWFTLEERELLERLDGGELVPDSELDASDLRVGIVSLAQVVVFTFVIVGFLAWFFRAYSNLEAVGARHLRLGRRWAVGAWFVPILALWRPKQIANDIWRGSDPAAPPAQGPDWRGGPVPALLAFWWGGFLLQSVLYNAANRASLAAGDVDAQLATSGLWIVTETVSALAALLAIVVVRRMTARQEERAATLGLAREELPQPLWERGTTWATATVVLVALTLQAGLAVAIGLSLESQLASPPPSASSGRVDSSLLVRDDFENPRSGWLNDTAPEATMGYVDGEYRITVLRKEYQQHSYVELLRPVERLHVTVDAGLEEGTRLDGYGIACWASAETSYIAVVFPDGYYIVAKEAPGADGGTLAEGKTPRRLVRGRLQENDLQFECSAGSARGRLRLVVNGQEVATATDRSPFPELIGVGLMAVSTSGRTTAAFDDIEVRRGP